MTESPKERKTEDWFYMIMSGIEGECGDMIFFMNDIFNIIESKLVNYISIHNLLQKINDKLNKQINIINRIYENVNQKYFIKKLENIYGGQIDIMV